MAEFIPNPLFAEQLRTAPFIRAQVTAIGKAAVSEAKRLAPVGSGERYQYPLRAGAGDRKPGSYRRSIRGRSGMVSYPGVGRTFVYRVFSNNYKARWIEYGVGDVAPKRILHRAVGAIANAGVQVR